jgi:thiamine-phosphate pyrophosphorylase
LEARVVKPMIDLCQQRGVAALIADDAALARKVRADGVHLSSAAGSAAVYAAARGIVGQPAIVGADAGISRHDAMTLAEAGADYVAFGAPARLHDREKARARRDDLLAWWAEIFQVPCVAFDVEDPREAEALARAGADFVAVTLAADYPAADASALVAEIGAAIRVGALAH